MCVTSTMHPDSQSCLVRRFSLPSSHEDESICTAASTCPHTRAVPLGRIPSVSNPSGPRTFSIELFPLNTEPRNSLQVLLQERSVASIGIDETSLFRRFDRPPCHYTPLHSPRSTALVHQNGEEISPVFLHAGPLSGGAFLPPPPPPPTDRRLRR